MELNYHPANYTGWPDPALYLCNCNLYYMLQSYKNYLKSATFFANILLQKAKFFVDYF